MPPPEVIEFSSEDEKESIVEDSFTSLSKELDNEILMSSARIEILKKTLAECRARLQIAEENLELEQEKKQQLIEKKFSLANRSAIRSRAKYLKGEKLAMKMELDFRQGLPETSWEPSAPSLVAPVQHPSTQPEAASPLPPPPPQIKRDPEEIHNDDSDLYTRGHPPVCRDEGTPTSMAISPSLLLKTEPENVRDDLEFFTLAPASICLDSGTSEVYHNNYIDENNGIDISNESFKDVLSRVPSSDNFGDVPAQSKKFNRRHISSVIGGQPQGAWATPDPKKNWPYKVGDYCCFQRDKNPYLPKNPGEKGCVFLTREDKLHTGTVYPIFIAEELSNWLYCGYYESAACCKLSYAEWRELTEEYRVGWCKHILSKSWGKQGLFRKGLITAAQVKEWTAERNWESVYEFFERPDDVTPSLRLLVRILRPYKYDRKLYNALCAANPRNGQILKEGSRKRRKVGPTERVESGTSEPEATTQSRPATRPDSSTTGSTSNSDTRIHGVGSAGRINDESDLD